MHCFVVVVVVIIIVVVVEYNCSNFYIFYNLTESNAYTFSVNLRTENLHGANKLERAKALSKDI